MSRGLHFTLPLLRDSLLAALLVGATTALLLLVGRQQLGEGVIALVYLVPVIWSGIRWGKGPGVAAALTAALCFDFLFIPPFYTFTIGSLEGWLILAIFSLVAVILVGRFAESQTTAREMTHLYELTSALANARTQEAVAHVTARHIQQLFQAELARMFVHRQSAESAELAASEPAAAQVDRRPDRQLPILNDWGLVGELQVWRGEYSHLPEVESPLFQRIAAEISRALARTQPEEQRHPPGEPRPIASSR
jgi:K+-sensing histidine kinase KdpD